MKICCECYFVVGGVADEGTISAVVDVTPELLSTIEGVRKYVTEFQLEGSVRIVSDPCTFIDACTNASWSVYEEIDGHEESVEAFRPVMIVTPAGVYWSDGDLVDLMTPLISFDSLAKFCKTNV